MVINIDIINKKFNRLTPLEAIKKYGRTYYICKCDCGILVEVKRSHITGNRTKSCGCLRSDELYNRKGCVSKTLKPDNISAKTRVYKSYEKHAKERKLEFDISLMYFVEITSKNCFYCNDKPSNKTKSCQSRSEYVYNGIDRVDNKIGYNKDNIVPCCKICNIAKSNMTLVDFKSWVGRLFKNKDFFNV